MKNPPLQALYAGGVLTSTWFTLPGEARYSYIYQGISQVLDHILVSPALLHRLAAVAPLHINKIPYQPYARQGSVIWRSSDHDPVAVMFSFGMDVRLFLPVVFNPR